MPSHTAFIAMAGAGAYATSLTFTSAAGGRALRGVPERAVGASVTAAGATGQKGALSSAMYIAGAAAASGFLAQAGRRGARRSVKAHAVLTSSAEVKAARDDFMLKKWVADKLAAEGVLQAAPAAQRAADAEAKWKNLEAEASGKPAAPTTYVPAPVAAAPASSPTPVAAAVATPASAVGKAELEEAKKQANLLAWAANTLAKKGAPQAAAAAQRAAEAQAKLKQLEAQASGQPAAPTTYAAAAPASSPTPVAAAVATPASAVGKAELEEAKKHANLLAWAANTLAEQGAPQAAAAAQRAAEAQAKLKQLEAQASGQPAAPTTYAAAAPASSPTPVAAAVAAPASAAGKAELEEAKKQANLLTWAANQLASKGALEAVTMKTRAEQAVAAYNAMLQQA